MSAAKIVHRPDVRGGSPTIDGTRLTVMDILWNYRYGIAELANSAGTPDLEKGQAGLPLPAVIDYILEKAYPHLSRDQVLVALAYWRDNPDEIDREIAEYEALAVELQKT